MFLTVRILVLAAAGGGWLNAQTPPGGNQWLKAAGPAIRLSVTHKGLTEGLRVQARGLLGMMLNTLSDRGGLKLALSPGILRDYIDQIGVPDPKWGEETVSSWNGLNAILGRSISSGRLLWPEIHELAGQYPEEELKPWIDGSFAGQVAGLQERREANYRWRSEGVTLSGAGDNNLPWLNLDVAWSSRAYSGYTTRGFAGSNNLPGAAFHLVLRKDNAILYEADYNPPWKDRYGMSDQHVEAEGLLYKDLERALGLDFHMWRWAEARHAAGAERLESGVRLLVTWFWSDEAIVMRERAITKDGVRRGRTESETSAEEDLKEYHLSATEDEGLPALVAALPPSTGAPSVGRLLLVSFPQDEQWRTRRYDRANLPKELAALCEAGRISIEPPLAPPAPRP
jgi:hypothetical protein